MTDTALYYALSTLAQCAAALAALIGFLSLWRLDYLHEEKEPLDRVIRQNAAGFISQRAQEQGNPLPYFPDPDLNKIDNDRLIAIGPEMLNHPSYGNEQQKAIFARWRALTNNEQRLMTVLVLFLVVTLVLILAPAIVGIVHVEWLKTWLWTPTLLYVAGALLAIAPTCVVVMAARSTRRGLILASLLALASPALDGPVRCQTYPEPTMGRLQTLCDDGTRAVSTWSPTLGRWDTTVTPPPGKTCQGRFNPTTHQWEGRCR
jgi:hypothetical protein